MKRIPSRSLHALTDRDGAPSSARLGDQVEKPIDNGRFGTAPIATSPSFSKLS